MAKQDFKTPDFQKIAEEALKDLPEKVGEKARAFFLTSFIKEGFTDTSFMAWPKRKDDLPHKLLGQSLALRASVKVTQADMKRVVVRAGEGLPYAAIHNEGGTISVTITDRMRRYFWYLFKKTGEEKYKWMALTKKERLTIRIPKRQFIGQSYILDQQLEKIFIKRIIKVQKTIKPK